MENSHSAAAEPREKLQSEKIAILFSRGSASGSTITSPVYITDSSPCLLGGLRCIPESSIGKRNLPFHYPKSPAALQKSPFWALVTLMLLLHELGKLLLEQQCLPVLEITSLAATQTSLQTATIRSRFHIYLKNY